jgi:glycosyltransferase involved in cell wall biosynthesis
MILVIHQHAKKLVRVRYKGEELEMGETDLCQVFWKLAEEYPEEIIAWCEEEFVNNLNLDSWKDIFHHDLIMASYGIKTTFLSDKIGYIDQLPFINVNRQVQYATWCMSTDVGGIKGKVLLQFQEMFGQVRNFGFLLNSIAKLGQQNGLFCYSALGLIMAELQQGVSERKLQTNAGNRELFSFVQAQYKNIRLWLLFWCFLRYDKSFPIEALIIAFFETKFFKRNIDLSEIDVQSHMGGNRGNSIDVIIPTLGRKRYLLQVLEDLKTQTLLPKKVIVVEQNPEPNSQTELSELKTQTWPFEIVHHFTHQTGACNARNIALEEVNGEWVFFADDDIRFEIDLLQKSLNELNRLGADCLNINCKQEDEKTIFPKIKQWGSFGSGTSIVNPKFCKNINFDEIFEFGFGEDQDYGMQLRNAGCDIIYHPYLEILHLKAPRGGFREIESAPWEKDKPKPSPTLMLLTKKYYTAEQLKGYKTELFLRYYSRQEIKNPSKYLKRMKEGWKRSEEWAERLILSSGVKNIEERVKSRESRSSL